MLDAGCSRRRWNLRVLPAFGRVGSPNGSVIVHKRNDGREMVIIVRRDMAGVPETDVELMTAFLPLALGEAPTSGGKVAMTFARELLPNASQVSAQRVPGGRVRIVIKKGED